MLKSFIGKVTARVRCEINSVYRGDWLSTAVLCTWALIYARHESWRSVSQHFSCLESSRNSAIKSFLLKHCEFGWNALPAGWYELGFLWLQERKCTFHEPKYNLFEGKIAAYHLRPDYDVNSKGASALIKICFHFVVPVWKVWSMSGISVLDAGRNRTSLDAVST